jgi:Flp pilus assembly protein TadG
MKPKPPRDSGSAVVEMAVALPLFLLVVFGVFEYALVLFTYCNATFACRHSARYAAMHSTTSAFPVTVSQLQTMTKSLLFLSSSLTPTVSVAYLNPSTGNASTNTVGNVVEVNVSWSQTLKVPYGPTQTVNVATQGIQVVTR